MQLPTNIDAARRGPVKVAVIDPPEGTFIALQAGTPGGAPPAPTLLTPDQATELIAVLQFAVDELAKRGVR